MKRIITLVYMLLAFSLTSYGQSNVTKKCKTCKKTIKECRYNGDHSKQQLTQEPLTIKGSLYISSTPSGAAVKLDGRYKGNTPLTLEELKPVSYSVTVSAEGYEPSTQIIKVSIGKPVTYNVNLKRKQESKSAQRMPAWQESQTKWTSTNVYMDDNTIVCILDGTEYRYEMVYVSGGTYTMGCTSEQGWRCDELEKPAHKVNVSGFYIGQTEVTQVLWETVMGNNPSAWKGNTLPVEKVSYNDVAVFISKLNGLTGKVFRLPTEEEWEFAARGGNNSRGYIFSGSDDASLVAWCDGNPPHSVKQKQPNELGLYDMSGNVNELCDNCWRRNFNGPDDCSKCVGRGGDSWLAAGDSNCNVSRRFGIDKSESENVTIGFRLAL